MKGTIVALYRNNGLVKKKFIICALFYEECNMLASSGSPWAPEKTTHPMVYHTGLSVSYIQPDFPFSMKMPDPVAHHSGIIIACILSIPWDEGASISHCY